MRTEWQKKEGYEVLALLTGRGKCIQALATIHTIDWWGTGPARYKVYLDSIAYKEYGTLEKAKSAAVAAIRNRLETLLKILP